MKKRILLISILMWVMSAALPQAGAVVSDLYTFDFTEDQELPRLKIIDFQLEDVNHREVAKVYAKETYDLKVKVENVGDGTARYITTTVDIQGQPASQLAYQRRTGISKEIKSGEVGVLTIPIVANGDLQTGTISMRVHISDPGDYTGFKKFETYEYDPPRLAFDNLCIINKASSEEVKKDGTLKRDKSYMLNFDLKNDSHSNARNLRVDVEFSEGVSSSSIGNGVSRSWEISSLYGYNKENVSLSFWIPEDYPDDKVSISVNVTSSTGEPLHRNLVCYIEKQEGSSGELEDIDKNVPVRPQQNNRFAIVVGNQNYDYGSVKYVREDARSVASYCEKVLGVKPENIRHYDNLSKMSMVRMLDEVCADLRNMPLGSEVIFYYAGHAACGKDSSAYLLPIDVTPYEAERGCRLRDLYAKLSSTGASLVTVFLDACYAGAGRNEDYLALNTPGRGSIVVSRVEEEVPGNTVVFSASQKEEAAYPYEGAGHGIFTYCLLSELKQNPEQTYNALYENVKKRVVDLSSKLLKGQVQNEQTPSIQVSNAKKNDWDNKYLKFN